jgi:phenylpyruvate tautomerase
MPLLRIETTQTLSEDKLAKVLKELSTIVAQTIGKPERYVMVTVSKAAILMSGKPGEAAFVDIRSIGGLSGETNRKLTEAVCRTLSSLLGISPDRVYLTFTDVDATDWGWNGTIFG